MSASFNEVVELTQPASGETFTAIVNGDEYGATFTTLDGYPVDFDREQDEWVYVQPTSHGRATRTNRPAHLVRPAGLEAAVETMKHGGLLSVNKSVETVGLHGGLTGDLRLSGTVTGLIVVVDFADVRAFDGALGCVARLHGGAQPFGRNSTTIRDFFWTISNRKLDFNCDIHPEIIHLPEPRATYMQKSFVPFAMKQIKEKATFSKYDSLNRGIVDCLIFLYAGDMAWGSRENNQLWPRTDSNHVTSKIEGGRKYRTKYHIVAPLGTTPDDMRIGTICHELGHALLCYPDLYDYGHRDQMGERAGLGDSDGIGPYCLMGRGNHVSDGFAPVPPCAYLRSLSGFPDKEVILNGVGAQHEIRADDYSTVYRYKLTDRESFFVENHTAVGLRSGMSAYRAGRNAPIQSISGLAVMLCDTHGSNEWHQNTPERHYQTYLLQADGHGHLESGKGANAGDLYRDIAGVAASATTLPSTRRWDGSDSGLVIRDVSAPGNIMTFVSGPGE